MADRVSNKLKLKNRLGQFASTQGRQAMNLDMVGPMTKLNLRVQYTHTAGGAAAAGPLFQQNARILQKIEVIVQGRDTVWNITPAIYAARHRYENHGVPMRGMSTVITNGIGTVSNVDLTIPLDFTLINGMKRSDAALDLRGLTLAQLAVTFGTAADMWTTPNGAVISNLVCSVEAEYLVNTTEKDTYITRALDELLYPITGTSNNFAFDIDARTGLAIRTIPLFFLTNNIGDDALCPVGGANPGWIRLQAGARQFLNTEVGFLKADVVDEYCIQPGDELVGVDFIDNLFDGSLATSIPTGLLDANLKIIANVTYAAGNSQVICQRESTRPLKI